MLVLTRRRDQRVVLVKNGEVLGIVEIADIRGDAVRLGFELPTEIGVHRLELWHKMQREQAAARHMKRYTNL